MKKIAIIACSKSKKQGTHKARDLYTGTAFKKALRLCELAGDYDAILIVSAKHGIVGLDDELASYDQRVPTDREGREWWGRVRATELANKLIRVFYGEHARIGRQLPLIRAEFFAGDEYIEPIARSLKSSGTPIIVERPLAGLGTGLRLRTLNERIADFEHLGRITRNEARKARLAQLAERKRIAKLGTIAGQLAFGFMAVAS